MFAKVLLKLKDREAVLTLIGKVSEDSQVSEIAGD